VILLFEHERLESLFDRREAARQESAMKSVRIAIEWRLSWIRLALLKESIDFKFGLKLNKRAKLTHFGVYGPERRRERDPSLWGFSSLARFKSLWMWWMPSESLKIGATQVGLSMRAEAMKRMQNEQNWRTNLKENSDDLRRAEVGQTEEKSKDF
jgi:hypothetical protein